MKRPKFIITTVSEPKKLKEESFTEAFLDDLKHLGISQEAMDNLIHDGRCDWKERDDYSVTQVFVEIVKDVDSSN